MNYKFTALLYFLVITIFNQLDAATEAAPEGEGKPCIDRHEPASINIPLAKGSIAPVQHSIESMADSLKVDHAEVDKAIVNWFNDKKKNDAKFFTEHQDIWNQWIEDTKTKARRSVSAIEQSWNQKVTTFSADVGLRYEAFVKVGSKGLVEGEYSWCEDKDGIGRDPGHPGWKVTNPVTFNPVQKVAVDISGGLAPVEINVELDGKVISGGAVTTIVSDVSADIDLQLSKDLMPATPDPSKKPIAKTGFLPKLEGKLHLSYSAHALLAIGTALDITVAVILPRVTGNIEASKDDL